MSLALEQYFSSRAYAVIGASRNREKWGNIVYRKLREKSFAVYPVNPHHAMVEGDRCYPTIATLPDDVNSVVLVVPPHITEGVVQECITRGIRGIWMQPGAESPRAIATAQQHNIATIYDACIMVVLSPVKHFTQLDAWLVKATTVY